MYEELELACNLDQLVLLYTDKSENFFCGNIVRIYQDDIVFKCYSNYGKFDGFINIAIEDIIRIEKNSLHNRKIEQLKQYYKNREVLCFKSNAHSALEGILQYAEDNDLVISICVDEESKDLISAGYVRTLTEQMICLEQVGKYGEPDGICLLQIENIVQVVCMAEYESSLRILSLDWHNKNKETEK